jgi:transcriptional regulator
MPRPEQRIDLMQGTLDLLILRTLLFGPSHGHAIAKRVRAMSDDVLHLETGSLYPALHRLEAQGLIDAEWDTSDKGKRARYYRLTKAGRRRLVAEQSKWERLSAAMARVLRRLPEHEKGRAPCDFVSCVPASGRCGMESSTSRKSTKSCASTSKQRLRNERRPARAQTKRGAQRGWPSATSRQ